MTRLALKFLMVIVALSVLGGCATAPERTLSKERRIYAALPNGFDPLHPDRPIPDYSSPAGGSYSEQAAQRGVIRNYERVRGHALHVITLSGGGHNGAFGAGFLKGWRESGSRPQFDIVAGVSTGALLATHALLGTEEDDATLEAIFTGISAADVYRKRGMFAVLLGADALSDTAPLKALIDKHITQETLDRVAVAYDEGRRLWVGTTNLDYDQTWVWNLTLIAKDNRPGALELYRKVLLASSSPPVAFPPVEIDGHLFADGATRQNLLIAGLQGTEDPGPAPYGPGAMYVIHNGRLQRPPQAVTDSFFALAGTGVTTMMNSSMQALLLQAYFAAKVNGYEFLMTQIPAGVDVGKNPLSFDPEKMRNAFAAGEAKGRSPDRWQRTPPNIGDFPPWVLKYLGRD